MSRLYILIRSSKPLEEIKKCHSLGVKLGHLRLTTVAIDPFCKFGLTSKEIENQTLNDEDIGILSL